MGCGGRRAALGRFLYRPLWGFPIIRPRLPGAGFRSPQHDEEVGEGLYLLAARWPVPSGQTARPASGHGCTGARRPPALLREAGTVPSKGTDPRSDEVKAPEMILVRHRCVLVRGQRGLDRHGRGVM